ncbi:MAG TPA: hypothetical protein VFB74_05955 [Kribbellaceae bacterium]|nr:hypothetical protein [Kribbellaceae bacterium]
MSGNVIGLRTGARVLLDGELVQVLELDGTCVTVRTERTGRFTTMTLGRLVAGCTSAEPAVQTLAAGSVGTTLAGLSKEQREQVRQRAGHVRQLLAGDGSSLQERLRAKASELGLSVRTLERTLERWLAGYRRDGEAGLVDTRVIRGRGSTVDPRWDEAVGVVMAEMVPDSTPSRSAVLARAVALLEREYGPGVVALPSQATAYRRMVELAKGTNAVAGSAKGRRSIADRPQGVYGRLCAMRPGEYVILDTQDLDVFAMEPVTCRWVGAQLTVAQDLFTRCILGLRVTPVSTKAVDVAGTLYESVAGREAPASWPEDAVWPYHGIPTNVVFDEDGPPMSGPVCAPETLVVDHGKVFLSMHVIAVCTRLGISIQPAQQHKPTDKQMASYCAPSALCGRGFGGIGFAGRPADAGSGQVGVGQMVEVLALVVGAASGEQALVAPGFDGLGRDAEVAGDLVEAEESLGAEALGVAGNLVCLADLADEAGVQGLAGAAGETALFEDGGGLRVGVFLGEFVDGGHDLGWGLAQLPGRQR